MKPQWAWDVGLRGRPHTLGNVAPLLGRNTGLEDFFAWMRTNFDPSASWSDLEWVRERWPGTLVVKGILDVDDAKEAIHAGADGVIVSNHGGRQLDGVVSSAQALPAIAEALSGQATIMVDGGIRSGLDVVRMIALGADAVMIGRAWAYALAARGELGVSNLIDTIRSEMLVAMALTGETNVHNLCTNNIIR